MKKIIVGILGLVMLMTAAPIVSASSTWNGASNDCKGLSILNATTNDGYGYPCWPSTSISADAGDTLNVRVYYHNTGSATANNTRVVLNAQLGSASTSKSFSGSISSDQGGLTLGSVTANLSSSQTLTFNSVKWYTNNTSETLTPLLNGQSGSEILNGGLDIGSIASGWATQGSLVVSFHVSNTVAPALCQDPTASNYGSPLPCIPVVVTPVCKINSFDANPSDIILGGSSTLSWSTKDCVSASISSIGAVNLNDTNTVSPTHPTDYILTAYGVNGIPKTSLTHVAVHTPLPVCRINSFIATPGSIQKGDSSVLSWSTTGCDNASISGLGSSVAVNGSQSVSPSSTTTYVLASEVNGIHADTRSITVYVNSAPKACEVNSFTPNPASIVKGGFSTLNWVTTNCENVTISNLSYGLPVNGSQPVYPMQTTTYVLTAKGADGVAAPTKSATVYVSETQTCQDPKAVNYLHAEACSYVIIVIPDNKCNIKDFSANDENIQSGDSVTLDWNTDNCESVKISDIGNVSDSGSKRVYPSEDITYVLTGYNKDGSHESETVRINVGDNNNNNNTCYIDNFTASNTYINSNDPVTLRWGTTGCNSANISNLGNVSLDGSKTVYPTTNTTYVLSAYGNNSVSRSIYVNVNYQQILPIVTIYNTNVVTTVATNITQTSASINGLITSTNYNNANVYFEYGTSLNLGSRTVSKPTNGNTNFSDYITNLSSNTIYFFQAVASDQNGISRGAVEVFRTLGYVNTNTNTNNTNTVRTNTQTTQQIVYQGITIPGSESPIVLRIENKYQTIGVGDLVDYVVYYKNISGSVLTHPMVQVTIPQGLTLLNSSRGTYSEQDHIVSVPIEDLYPEAEGVIYLQARVDSIDVNLAQIVTTAVLVYTNPNGAQENAMAYVLNNPRIINGSVLGASAFFGGLLNIGLLGWLIILILILLLVLAARSYDRRGTNVYYPNHNNVPPQN